MVQGHEVFMSQQVQTTENTDFLIQSPIGEETQLVSEAESKEGGIASIGINGTSLVFQIINFIILFILLKKFLFKPVGKYLEERRTIIEESLKNAQDVASQKEQWELEKQKLLEDINKKSDTIIAQAKADAQKLKKENAEQTQTEQKKIIENAKKEIEALKEKTLNEAKKDLVALVIDTTKKVVGKTLDAKSNEHIVKESIKDLV